MKFSTIASAVVATLSFAAGVTAQVSGWDDYSKCSKIDVRKEVHDMTTADWERWRKVIRAAATDYNTTVLNLANLPLANYNGDVRTRLTKYQNDLRTVGGSMSVWDQIGWLHNAYHLPIHGNHIFLIWHRHFTRWVEQILQRYDPDFTFFYWATHLMPDARIWQTDPTWEHMGKAVKGRDLTDGPLAGIILRGNVGTVSRLRGLFRDYTLTDTTYYLNEDSEWSTLDNYNYAYTQSIPSGSRAGGFNEYAYWAEGFHAYVHISQGGVMSGMASPLDPMFFAHHSNVDYLYHTAQEGWNVKNRLSQALQLRGSCPANSAENARCLTLNTRLPYFEIPVSQAQFISQQCIRYAPPIVGPWTGKAPEPPKTTTTTTTTAAPITSTTTTTTSAISTPTSIWVRPTFPSGTRYVGANTKCGTSNGGAVCNINLCCAYPLNTNDFYCGATAKHCGPGRCNPAFGSCWANATIPVTTTTTTSLTTTLPVTTMTTTTLTTTTTTRTATPSPTSIFVRPTFPSGTRYVGRNTKCGSSNGGAVCNTNLCCAYPLNTNDFYCGSTANHCGTGRCNPVYGSCWANATTTPSTRRRRALDLSVAINLGGGSEEGEGSTEESTSTSSYIKPSATRVEDFETESSHETTTAAETASETTTETETATETAVPPEDGGHVVLEPLTYESSETPLHQLPEWWLEMTYRGPNAPAPARVAADLYRGCKEVAEAVKRKEVLDAPVEYMKNNYTGVLPVVPTTAVEEVYPEAVISYGKPTYVPVVKKKCKKHTTFTVIVEPTDVPAYGAEETTPAAVETLYGKFY